MNHLTSDTPAFLPDAYATDRDAPASPPDTPLDAAIAVLVALSIGFVLILIWLTAAGRFAQEPSPTTWYAGDGDAVEVTP